MPEKELTDRSMQNLPHTMASTVGHHASRGKPNGQRTLQRGLRLAVVLGLLAAPAAFGSEWILRLRAGAATSAGDRTTILQTQSGSIVDAVATQELADGSGFQLALEWRFGERWGVELGLTEFDFDTTFNLVSGVTTATMADQEKVGVETFTLGMNYHLLPERRFDLAVGLFVAMSKPEDVAYNTESGRNDKLSFDDDIGLGAKVALDVPLGSSERWVLSSELSWIDSIFESEYSSQDLSFSPFALTVGVGVRF